MLTIITHEFHPDEGHAGRDGICSICGDHQEEAVHDTADRLGRFVALEAGLDTITLTMGTIAEVDRFNALNPWEDDPTRRLIGEGAVGRLRPLRSVQFALWDHENTGSTL